MSLSFFRDTINQRLQARADAATGRALNVRPRYASPNQPAMTSDEYAMLQIDALAEARTCLEAIKIVTAEYVKLIEPEKTQEAQEPVKQLRESAYG